MCLLFEVTEIDFQLLVDHSSFLDESWVVPVFRGVQLPPIKTLDVKLKYEELILLLQSISTCMYLE